MDLQSMKLHQVILWVNMFFWVTTPQGGCVSFGLRSTDLSRSGQERNLVGE